MSGPEQDRPAPKPVLDREQLDELRASVAALRDEISARFGTEREDDLETRSGEAEDAREPAEHEGESPAARSELDPWELWERARSSLANLGMRDRDPQTDDFGMEPLFVERTAPLFDFLVDRWWRVQVSGEEDLPLEESSRILFVANRSGVLPYDGLVIAHLVQRLCPALPRPRFLVADWLATLPIAQPTLARLGGVRACRENAERLLTSGRPVIAFPEGQKGALKPFSERYRLQRFARGGFIGLAIRTRAIVVPVAVVGAEEAHPILLRWNLLERLVGVPVPLTPTFPHLGPLGAVPLPSRWRLRFGEPVRFDQSAPEQADDPLYVNLARERVRGTIQELVEDELHQRRSVFSG